MYFMLFRLRTAKETELGNRGLWRLEKGDMARHINKEEQAKHCKRRTKGVEEATRLMKDVIYTFGSERRRKRRRDTFV